MRIFDSHCHFERADAAEIAATLTRAKAAGVEALLAVGGSESLNASALLAAQISANNAFDAAEMSTQHPLPRVMAACGRDRDQIGKAPCATIAPGISAIGEIGLDYHYSPETRKEQLTLFLAQLELASNASLPVVIHTREADDDTLGALREVPSKGIIHCFTGSPQFCRKLLDLGFYVSISGIVTFHAANNVRETALAIPDDRLLVETDSPFLAPVPMRGKANEPAFIVHTVKFLATLRGTTPDALAEATFRNAEAALEAGSLRY